MFYSRVRVRVRTVATPCVCTCVSLVNNSSILPNNWAKQSVCTSVCLQIRMCTLQLGEGKCVCTAFYRVAVIFNLGTRLIYSNVTANYFIVNCTDQSLLEPMKLTPMGVISPILAKEINKFHNNSELLRSSLPVYSDRCRVQLYCQTFAPSKVCAQLLTKTL